MCVCVCARMHAYMRACIRVEFCALYKVSIIFFSYIAKFSIPQINAHVGSNKYSLVMTNSALP